jgi:hypothetical protein
MASDQTARRHTWDGNDLPQNCGRMKQVARNPHEPGAVEYVWRPVKQSVPISHAFRPIDLDGCASTQMEAIFRTTGCLTGYHLVP